MSSKTFKLSAVAATVFTALSANAAIYNVTQYAPEGTDVDTYGVAIGQSSPVSEADSSTSCWTTGCTATDYDIAVETKKYPEGFSYRDEAPFFLRYGYEYLADDYDGFEDYCNVFLGYTDSLCEDWAEEQWEGYSYELNGNYDNSIAYLYSTSSEVASENTVVNAINSDGVVIGNAYEGDSLRTTAFVDGSSLDLPSSGTFTASHAWNQISDGSSTYTVGSISTEYDDESSTSKATVWVDGEPTQISWVSAEASSSVAPQGSARDIIYDSDNSTLYAVGYNSNSKERLIASVFKSTDSGATWSNTFVSNFKYDVEDDYANSVLTSVNDNKVAIGTAKLEEARNGAYANGLFYVTNVASPSYKEFSGSIFFSGANGEAGAINNYNEVVGTIDYETHREINGNPRAQRGFIAPLKVSGSTNNPRDVFGNTAYYLDDLTNDGSASSNNNQYRIFKASDINDDGVIAATAYYCAGGYDTTNIDSTCGAGTQDEKIVAVRLTPISGATNSDIETRGETEVTVSRSGGSLGWITLTLLGFIRFRKK
ncbi:GlyGly-CTERM domain-containing protein [Vibrio xiamenensis]|uniref:GlyGly-CTERM domain-containing protein n=1 Tax=Vibrio xiamenensis TaxID=861298 RepID=A0A1G7YDG0_9VIBR|nr:DUF3466 family protein [Vibrio xiamenensis]SDG94598.1 GlyGly-CTERM domain-containing protein [Vibrio xiamenensis]